jgi:hypothetical protein
MIVENTEATRDIGRSNRWTISERENSIEVLTSHRFQDRIGCRIGRFEMNRYRAISPGIVEFMAAVRDKHKIGTEFASGFIEAARLVAEFGGEDEESWHLLLF